MRINSDDVVAPASSVSVYDAIFRRRNVKEFNGGADLGRDAGAAVLDSGLGAESQDDRADAVLRYPQGQRHEA